MQEDSISRAVKHFSCGLCPICGIVLQKLKKEPTLREPDLDQWERFASLVVRTEESMQAFQRAYPSWEKERRECIKEIKKLANDIDFHHRNIEIARLPTGAVSIVGGVLTILGVALTPVTFGASLALTISGAVIGTGATVTGITTTATDIGIQATRLKKAKDCAEKHKLSTDKILKLAEELFNNCGEVEALSSLTDCAVQLAGELTRASIMGIKNVAVIGKAIAHTIPKASKSLHLLRGAKAAADASSMRTVGVARAGSATKVVATTAGKVFTGVGVAFSAVGIVFDLVSVGISINGLAKGSKTSAATKLREQATNLQKELEILKEVYNGLNES